MRKLLILTLLAVWTFPIMAQENAESKKGFKYNNHYDLAIGAGNGFSTALSWTHFHKIGKKGKFQIGYGVRLSSLFGSDLEYITAPADLTSGGEKNLDTLKLSSTQLNALNLTINLQYAFTEKLEFGFNIDALGFTFGGEQKGMFTARSQGRTPSQEMAKPTSGNILLVGDNDRGSLNSQFYLRYWINPKWAIRGGVSYIFGEYTASRKLVLDNDRFRAKIFQPMIAITFSPYR
jgi:hypothetical protein